MSDIEAKKVETFANMKFPGNFMWHFNEGTPNRMTFVCPCGCGAFGGVLVEGEHAWNWNGNLEKPTTTPSIRFLDGCNWHGYLTDGIFRSC